MKWRWFLLVIVVAFSGCTDEGPIPFEPPSGFKGKITMTVSAPERDGFENRTFLYDLNAGILDLKEKKHATDRKADIQPFSTGAVSCHDSLRLVSPDGKFVAHCEVPSGAKWNSMVFEDVSGKQVWKQGAGYDHQVIGYAWAPDSRGIAIAERFSGISFYPLDLITAIGGHPVPMYEFGVFLMRVDPKDLQSLPDIQEDFRLGVGILAGWK